MIPLHINNETSNLVSVVLGIATHNGNTPRITEVYDPKSLEHVLAGTYPIESDMIQELDAFCTVLKKYNVTVYRPETVKNCNQIFTRDIGFVIGDCFVISNILPNREEELHAIQYIINQLPTTKIKRLPKNAHVEGGDVMLWQDYIFVGTYSGTDYPDLITARTNREAVACLTELFPDKKVKSFDLIKSNIEARDNALHLDCCFQPVGNDKAIIYQQGFSNPVDYLFLVELFGADNLFHITRDEMYAMYSNVFSIRPDVVVSEKNFTRLNNWLRQHNFTVEEIPFAEISKQEGLLRCSTLPLHRTL